MTIFLREFKVPVEQEQSTDALQALLARFLETEPSEIRSVQVRKRSLDARKKTALHYVYQLEFEASGEEALLRARHDVLTAVVPKRRAEPLDHLVMRGRPDLRHPPVVIGTGPAGTFASLVLSEAGIPCQIFDRGEAVERRLKTVGRLLRHGQLDPESNYCFGEGGAGTFSDGKLTCGRNHPLIDYLFRRWVEFGAPSSILWEAHPHIGTDHLLRVAKRMRAHIAELGSAFHFGTRLEKLLPGGSDARHKLVFSDGQVVKTDHIVLAIGHSARDTYQMLLDQGLSMAPKPFALGARFEHPQDHINRIQFGSCAILPAAEYKLAVQAGGRGIWTFCMCPGGHLLPTSAQPGHLAINGMSYHARKSGFANAAVVVNIQREDFFRGHVLDGVAFQERLETAAFEAGGGDYFSPAQRLTDFLAGRPSKGELQSTYRPGVTAARVDRLLPPFVVDALRSALVEYNKRMRDFISHEAIVAGVESKTSAPVVMNRSRELESISHPGLYPAGEGAGFAGGIVSAALDGVRVATALVEALPQVRHRLHS